MDLTSLSSPGTAFLAGIVTSLHCAGMCGPLACSLMMLRGRSIGPATVSDDTWMLGTVYHLSRLAGYALVGALAGGIGQGPINALSQSALRWLPWLLVVFFVGLALRWDRFLPKPVAIGRATWRLQAWLRARSRWEAAAGIGLATPLLPCGPLYFVIAFALLSGSTLRGIETMLAFGLGTVPLLWLAQSQFHRLREKLAPARLQQIRTVLALAAALVIGWRLRATLGFAGPDPATFICH